VRVPSPEYTAVIVCKPVAVEVLGRSLTVAVHVVCRPLPMADGGQETPVCVGDKTMVVVGPVTLCVTVLTDVVVSVIVWVFVTVAVDAGGTDVVEIFYKSLEQHGHRAVPTSWRPSPSIWSTLRSKTYRRR
jgi:hypothetical protein